MLIRRSHRHDAFIDRYMWFRTVVFKHFQKKKKKTKAPVKTETKTSPKKKGKANEPEQEVWKWWEEEKADNDEKWRFLEHKGPVFAPDYERMPSHVKFFYDGKDHNLCDNILSGFFLFVSV